MMPPGAAGIATEADGGHESTVPFGRADEVAALRSMLDAAVAGRGSALLLRGAAGIGKTGLLAEARRLAAPRGLRVLACSGVRAEAHLPFAGLHQLTRPVLSFLPSIPAAQGDLLRAALGLDESLIADRHRVATAALELLAAAAEKEPLLVVADDAHWLDRPSADVLAFVSRRVGPEPIAVVLSVRDGAGDPFQDAGVPSVRIGALDGAAAQALVARVAPDLDGGARERLLAAAVGNPLALVELSAMLRSAGPLPGRLPAGGLLCRSFTACMAELPAPARHLLSVAAADAGCRLAQLCAAASAACGLAVTEPDIQPAIDAGLVRLEGERVVFGHPLLGTAIYQSLPVGDRQRAHRTLAQVSRDCDERRIWHLAAAALGPDDGVAADLEALADRAGRRGAAMPVAALDRAAALVTDQARQADLMLRSTVLATGLARGQLNLDAAAAAAEETERLGRELSQPMVRGAAVLELATVTALRGDYAPAKRQMLAALDSEAICGVRLCQAMAWYALAVAALGVGRYQEAYAYLRRLADPADPVSHEGARQWLVGDLAEAASADGRAAQDAPMIARLTADLRDHPIPAVRYSVLYADAMLASDQAAQARFEAALAADSGDSPLTAGRLRLAYGSWLRRHRWMREARAELARARDTFTSLGTGGFAYRASRELHAAGAPRQEPCRVGGLPGLTPQELQIAELAAQGMSNRQIGGQLFLSHRTVGSHLYHLFPKLGITARAQLADALATAWAGSPSPG